MSRDGGHHKKGHTSTMAGPTANSKTSKRRANRGFKSLEQSSRIHRKALKNQAEKRFFDGKMHECGEKAECAGGPNPRKQWIYTAGGALRYH